MGAADDGSSKTALPHSPVAIELQEDGMRQPIDMGIQAANAVAQPLGQHRNHTVGQINTVAAALRFAIERAAGPHIRAHIRDMNAKLPAAFDFFDVNGVVKIARVIWIDGHDKLAGVDPRDRRWRRQSPFRELRMLPQERPWKLDRQMVFPDDR